MNVETVDNVGIQKLKQFHMVNIKTKFPRGISDQVISLGLKPTGRLQGVHPGPGLKLRHGGLTPEASGSKLGEMDIASSKPQASSFKLQASSFRTNLFKLQAASVKPQAASVKRQATSGKLTDPRTMVHGYWRSFRG